MSRPTFELFFVPFVGLALGGALGALFGKMGKSGADDQFWSQVQAMLPPGRVAVVIMASKITEDKLADAMKSYGGEPAQDLTVRGGWEKAGRERTGAC
ncbi:MAG: DUF1269 domain-containing protein [Candidatus Nanopelagicales bacterium]